jgi:hypothetical protein
MLTSQDNRVLNRKGARTLTAEELDAINGNGGSGTALLKDGVTTTLCSVANPVTGKPDGDCD